MDLSVVIPCYNEQESLAEMHMRVSAACAAAPVDSHEIVLVNDGSTDGTLPLMLTLLEKDPALVVVDLSRNHGHQLALSAGLAQAKGDYILIIDADLQDPPELLTPMLEMARGGVDVVYGHRLRRDGETPFRLMLSTLFYRVLNFLSDVPIPVDTGDFRLMSRRVLDHLLSMPEQHRYIRGMISWIGFRQEPFHYTREARFAGTTHYTMGKLLQFAADAITSFSIKPLRVSLLFAVGGVVAAVLLALAAIISHFYTEGVAGWASLAAIIAFFSSLQLICIGMIGEYIGRTYLQSKNRPLFVIRDIHRKTK